MDLFLVQDPGRFGHVRLELFRFCDIGDAERWIDCYTLGAGVQRANSYRLDTDPPAEADDG